MNESISLWTSDAEDLMHQLQEEMQLWPGLESPLFDEETRNRAKKIARHALVQNYCLSLKVKQELLLQEPTIYGIIDMDNNDPVEVWMKKQSGKLHANGTKRWDLLLKAERMSTRQYSFVKALDAEKY